MITNPLMLVFGPLLWMSQANGGANMTQVPLEVSAKVHQIQSTVVMAEEQTSSQEENVEGEEDSLSEGELDEPASGSRTYRQQILANLCEEKGFEVASCWRTLEAMIIKESSGLATAVGDQGRSHGYYQIQVKLHNVSLSCAQDLVCSTNWTLNHLERHGYPNNEFYAIKRHNGSGPMAERYATHVLSMASQF